MEQAVEKMLFRQNYQSIFFRFFKFTSRPNKNVFSQWELRRSSKAFKCIIRRKATVVSSNCLSDKADTYPATSISIRKMLAVYCLATARRQLGSLFGVFLQHCASLSKTVVQKSPAMLSTAYLCPFHIKWAGIKGSGQRSRLVLFWFLFYLVE